VAVGPTKLPHVFLYRCLGPLTLSLTLTSVAMAAAPAASFAEVQSPAKRTCAGATTTTRGPAGAAEETKIEAGESPPQGGCWEDVQPYPFSSGGGPAGPSTQVSCDGLTGSETCYLKVVSMAFTAWNRGLALTTVEPGAVDPYPVWRFNGTQWYPESSFLGSKACPGQEIVWAGLEDFWVVGTSKLCRFDGQILEWEPLEIPPATKERLQGDEELAVKNSRESGRIITSAACLSWSDCWFFGRFGTVVRWNGEEEKLSDASPDRLLSLLQGEYTAAMAREGPAGELFTAAVGATSESDEQGPLTTGGAAPPQLFYASGGEPLSPLPFTPFTQPLTNDPYRTDLVAVGFDSAGQGWVAGNPAGLRLISSSSEGTPRYPEARPPQPDGQPEYSPLEPVSASGAASACKGPPENRFAFTAFPETTTGLPEEPGSFLWSSLAVVPTLGEALAGGGFWPATNKRSEDNGEPVIARASCDGTTSVTRFRIHDASPGGTEPADPRGTVTTIVATASNDAWAATTPGKSPEQPPHLYRLTNGQEPDAPKGPEVEPRPEPKPEEQTDVGVEETNPPLPPVEAPATVIQSKAVKLPPAIYDVKAKLHTSKRDGKVYLSLYVTFKLRRSVTIGAQALRKGRVVSEARPRHFVGRSGTLILSLNRQHWPTKVSFIT
jgi:hypothetical protein